MAIGSTFRTTGRMICMCTLLLTLFECSADNLGGDIADELATFANDGLGVEEFQNYLDNQLTFIDEALNASALVKQIAKTMSDKLQVRIDALTDMRTEIQEVYKNNQLRSTNPFTGCCDVEVHEKDALLNTEVNYQKICTIGQGVSSASEFLPDSMTDVIRTQYEKALGIKYAFFGTEEGVMFNYPALRVCQPSYDPRFRPWYVETASPEPKDVVIVIDKSGSMGKKHGDGTLMDIAIDAAKTVLETLNPNDRVGIVTFSDNADTPSGLSSTSTCYKTEMAKATAENKDYLNTYISGLNPDGATFYIKALDAAFDYFDRANEIDADSVQTEDRDKVILFMTDGEHTEANAEDIYNKIALRNVDIGNEVVILTYGLGITDNDTAQVLRDMAHQIKSDSAYGEVKGGSYQPVNDPDNLRSAMASYYDQFLSGNSNIIFSVPYLDAFGTGLLISMCLPVMISGDFKGVTCMDLAVDDLLADITYFREGETSYAFIIDEYGRVLTHPLLPNPSEITNNPLFIYISALETVADIDAIRNSMVSGESGTQSGTTRLVTSRGNVQLEGVLWENQQATYSWSPITGTRFSVCLVVGDGDERSDISWSGAYPEYVYHRLDLISGVSTCNTFDRVAVKDRSSVMFAARAFEDPFGYLYGVETVNDVTEYETYLSGSSSFNPGFKAGVRETVGATAKFEELMRDPQNDYNMYSVWRYVSTDNGVHRIYPGVEIPKNYDPTQRTWYLRAKAYKGRITVSTPYEDAFGAGIVVTLSQAIYEGNPTRQHTTSDRAIAVMGADFTLQYFYNLATHLTDSCDDNTCLVIDNAGFIIAHKDWITPSKTPPTTANVHVADREPYLADRLEDANLMKYSACVNVEELRDQYFWKVSISSSNNGFYETQDFELHEIDNTNIFLVILKQFSSSATCKSCSSSYVPCQLSSCFCPCYSKADIYKYCLGEFDFNGDNNPPCTPSVPEVSFTDVNKQDASRVAGLSKCYDYDCVNEAKSTDDECSSVITCSWCAYDKSEQRLTDPYCSTSEVCPGGYLNTDGGGDGTTDSGGDDGGGSGDRTTVPSDSGASLWWIAVIIIVLLAAAAVAGFFIYKKMSSSKKGDSAPSTPAPQPPPTVAAASSVSGSKTQGFDNLAMVQTNYDYVEPANRPQPMAPPPPLAGYGGYVNPVAYSGMNEGGGYQVAKPQSHYESLDYKQMSTVPTVYKQAPPPAFGSIH